MKADNGITLDDMCFAVTAMDGSTVAVGGEVASNGQTTIINGSDVSIGEDLRSAKSGSPVAGVYVTDSRLEVEGDVRTPLQNMAKNEALLDKSRAHIYEDLYKELESLEFGEKLF